MPKHIPKIKLSVDAERPWLYVMKFDYHPKLVDEMNKIPGANFDWQAKLWRWPIEMVETLSEIAARHGYVVSVPGSDGR